MTIIQLAKTLQVAGFLLASIFGGILLDEAVGGKIAKGFTALLVGSLDRLRKSIQKLEIWEIRWESQPPESKATTGTGIAVGIWSLLCIGGLITLIIGWLEHIPVLLRIGACFYFISNAICLGLVLSAARRHSAEVRLILFIPFMMSGIYWFFFSALFILSNFYKTVKATTRILASPRTPKVAFIVLGFLMLLAGLIIDAIAAF